MTSVTIARLLLAAGLTLAGFPARSEAAASPQPLAPAAAALSAGSPADDSARLPPGETTVHVAAAASAAGAERGLAPQPPLAQSGHETHALLLVIAALLVVAFLSTRRQNEDR